MRVDVSAKIVSFPQVCVCCLGPPDRPLVSLARGKSWSLPHCGRCAMHAATFRSATNVSLMWLAAGGVASVGAMGVLSIAVSPVLGVSAAVVVGIATFVVAYRAHEARHAAARAMCSPSCGSVVGPARFAGWHGHVQTFDFANAHYAARFMAANREKLLGLTHEARQLLAWHDHQRAGVAREAEVALAAQLAEIRSAHEAQLEEIEIPVWLTRLETARGPAARREVLARALAATKRQDLRDRLKLEASKVEVRSALDKADGLKTPAAKRRVLAEALGVLRADTVPDELQADQIRWLEAALDEARQDKS
jgi:hypothetical protein